MKPFARLRWSFALFSALLGACSDKPRAEGTDDSGVHAEAGTAVVAQPLLAPFDVTLTAAADAFLAQGTPTFNFGADSAIRITGVSLSGWEAGLVSFDAAAIQNAVGTNTLQSARLEFTLTSASLGAGDSQVAIHRMSKAWSEQGATWLCANDTDHSLFGRLVNNCSSANSWGIEWWSFLPRPFVEQPTATVSLGFGQTGVVTADVTSDVQLALSGTAHRGWMLMSTANLRPFGRAFHRARAPPPQS